MPPPSILTPLPREIDPQVRFVVRGFGLTGAGAGDGTDAEENAALIEAADACRTMMIEEMGLRQRRRTVARRVDAAEEGATPPQGGRKVHRIERVGLLAGVRPSGEHGMPRDEAQTIEGAIACALVDFRVDIGGPMLRSDTDDDVSFVCELSRRFGVTTAQAHAAIVVWVVWLEATVQQHEYTTAAEIDDHARRILEANVLRAAGATALVARVCGFWLRRRMAHVHSLYRPTGLPLALVGTTKQPGHFRRTDVADLRRLLAVDDGQITLRWNLCSFLQRTLLLTAADDRAAPNTDTDDDCGADVIRRAATLAGITSSASSSPLVAGNDLAALLDTLSAAAYRWRGGGGSGGGGTSTSRQRRPPVPLGRQASDAVAQFIRRRCGEASVRLDESDAWRREGLYVDMEDSNETDAVRATRVLMRSAACTVRCLRDQGGRGCCGCPMTCVLRSPDDLDPVPFVPECMRGLFDLRDRLLAAASTGSSAAFPVPVLPAMVTPDLHRLAAAAMITGGSEPSFSSSSEFQLLRPDTFGVVQVAAASGGGGIVVVVELPISRGFRFDELLDTVWREPAACPSTTTATATAVAGGGMPSALVFCN